MEATNIMSNPRNGKLGLLNEDDDDDDDDNETISMARMEPRSTIQ